MHIGVAYGESPENHVWLRLEVPDGSTVRDAIEISGLLKRFPSINLETNKVGIYGKVVKLDTELKEDDRVEIYREITADPKKVPQRKIDNDDDDDDDDD